MKLISIMLMLATALLGVDLTTTPADEPVVTAPRTVPEVSILRSKPPETTTTTTTTIFDTRPPEPVQTVRIIGGIDKARYPQWWSTALDAGWPTELLPTLDLVIHKESRGLPEVVGQGSWGLTQIQWSAHRDWIGGEREQLLDPAFNLTVAWTLYQLAEDMYGCGWQPWYMSLGDPYQYC